MKLNLKREKTNIVKIAIIGSGPSGFYAAKAITSFLKEQKVQIDIYDRLPTPFGLLRGGVAPDHQNIKRIAQSYSRQLTDYRIRFVGNVCLGKDVSNEELCAHYHATIYATGNESARKLGISGEELNGVHSATEFVYWYNGHPNYRDHQFRIQDGRRIMVVGNGNVSIDVARILAKRPKDLGDSDITTYALKALQSSPLEELIILGRRGPAQSAFSPKEIQELSKLDGSTLLVSQRDIDQGTEKNTMAWLGSNAPLTAKKNLAFLKEHVSEEKGEGRVIRCSFFVSPVEFYGENGNLTQVKLRRNILVEHNGRLSSKATDEEWIEDVQLVFYAIGYRGVAIPGVPFDDWKGIIPNQGGRVIDPETKALISGLYVVGWAKRGPTGLIGTNRSDAEATVEKLISDLPTLMEKELENADLVASLKSKGVRVVNTLDWFALDAEEIRRGEEQGKIREKFTRVDDMLEFLDSRKNIGAIDDSS